MGESEIWTAWEMIAPEARTRELKGKTYAYHVSQTALLHAVVMAEPGEAFWPLCGRREVKLSPNWSRWEDVQAEISSSDAPTASPFTRLIQTDPLPGGAPDHLYNSGSGSCPAPVIDPGCGQHKGQRHNRLPCEMRLPWRARRTRSARGTLPNRGRKGRLRRVQPLPQHSARRCGQCRGDRAGVRRLRWSNVDWTMGDERGRSRPPRLSCVGTQTSDSHHRQNQRRPRAGLGSGAQGSRVGTRTANASAAAGRDSVLRRPTSVRASQVAHITGSGSH